MGITVAAIAAAACFWRTRSRLSAWVIYGAPVVLVICALVFGLMAAPCEDFLDGRCQSNWATAAGWVVVSLAGVLVPVTVIVGLYDLARLLRKRRQRSPGALAR
jgi:small-conductance mechanosensitive channel